MPSPLYRSAHPHSTPPTASTFGASIATTVPVTNVGGEYDTPAKVHPFVKDFAEFGPKSAAKPDPLGFVAAHSGEKAKLAGKAEKTQHQKVQRKPSLDTRLKDAGSLSLSSSSPSSRNFIAENTTRAVNMKAKRPDSKEMDYLQKDDFGKVPTYLNEVKEQVETERIAVQQAYARANGQHNATTLSVLKPEDQQGLLLKLKVRWEETMKNYQLLTHMNANNLTIGNLKRKEQLEQQLQEIELAIAKIDHAVVLIRQPAQ